MSEWCPTRNGNYTGHKPEYLGEDGNWHAIPTKDAGQNGVPQPLACGNINAELGLFGYEQAWALAWQFAAQIAAQHFAVPKIRVAQFEVVYDIKAKRLDLALTHAE